MNPVAVATKGYLGCADSRLVAIATKGWIAPCTESPRVSSRSGGGYARSRSRPFDSPADRLHERLMREDEELIAVVVAAVTEGVIP